MNRYGFNISLRNTAEEIRDAGEKFLGSGLYEAIEVTYYGNMAGADVKDYNDVIMELVEKYKPWVSVHLADFNLCEENMSLREAIFAEIKDCFEYTKKLGGSHVVIHCGRRDGGRHLPPYHFFGNDVTEEKVLNRMIELSVDLMKRACALAKEYGITIFTENLLGSQLLQHNEQLNHYLDLVGYDNLKIVFDVGHSFVTKHNVAAEVLVAGERLQHLHLHDNNGLRDQHACIGDGDIDYKSFVNALKEIHYPGIYMLELDKISEKSLTTCREILSGLLEE